MTSLCCPRIRDPDSKLCYAPSRVRSLECSRSVGLDARVREILEQAPPDTLPLRFRQLFAEKEAMTREFAEQCLTTLGW